MVYMPQSFVTILSPFPNPHLPIAMTTSNQRNRSEAEYQMLYLIQEHVFGLCCSIMYLTIK